MTEKQSADIANQDTKNTICYVHKGTFSIESYFCNAEGKQGTENCVSAQSQTIIGSLDWQFITSGA